MWPFPLYFVYFWFVPLSGHVFFPCLFWFVPMSVTCSFPVFFVSGHVFFSCIFICSHIRLRVPSLYFDLFLCRDTCFFRVFFKLFPCKVMFSIPVFWFVPVPIVLPSHHACPLISVTLRNCHVLSYTWSLFIAYLWYMFMYVRAFYLFPN